MEEEQGRQEDKEVKRGGQSEETAHVNMDMEMGRMARTGAKVHVNGCNQNDYLRTVHGGQWMCSVECALCGVTQAFMSSLTSV